MTEAEKEPETDEEGLRCSVCGARAELLFVDPEREDDICGPCIKKRNPELWIIH